MKIVLTADSTFSASRLKDRILMAIKGDNPAIPIVNWSYARSSDNYDVIFYNISQYTDDPVKNVIFRVELDGENVYFTTAYWTRNPQPAYNMYCAHIGHLTEMLLSYFKEDITRFSVVNF